MTWDVAVLWLDHGLAPSETIGSTDGAPIPVLGAVKRIINARQEKAHDEGTLAELHALLDGPK